MSLFSIRRSIARNEVNWERMPEAPLGAALFFLGFSSKRVPTKIGLFIYYKTLFSIHPYSYQGSVSLEPY